MSVNVRSRGQDGEMGSVQLGRLYPAGEAAGRQIPPSLLCPRKFSLFHFLFGFFFFK